jgi:phage/plasmid-like protein (TIGR03299 family)
MSHEIEQRSGVHSIAYAGKTPWHELGRRLSDVHCPAQLACAQAGIGWSVFEAPLFADAGKTERVASHKAIARDIDGKILGVVGKDYEPVQHVEAFERLDPIVAVERLGRWDCLGSLRGGKIIFGTVKLGEADIVSGDPVERYLLAAMAHDGSMSFTLGLTEQRAVCMNTLRIALGARNSQLFRLRHTKSVGARIDDAVGLVSSATAQFEASEEKFRYLARRGFTQAQLRELVKIVFPVKTKAPTVLATSAARASTGSSVLDDVLSATENSTLIGEILEATETDLQSRAYDTVAELFEAGQGNTTPGVKGTAWAAYNAMTEYLTHRRGRTTESRAYSNWFGEAAAQNARALETVLEMVDIAR